MSSIQKEHWILRGEEESRLKKVTPQQKAEWRAFKIEDMMLTENWSYDDDDSDCVFVVSLRVSPYARGRNFTTKKHGALACFTAHSVNMVAYPLNFTYVCTW